MASILYILGLMTGVIALAMIVPALVAAALGETQLVATFLFSAALTAFIAGGLSFGLSGRERRLRRSESLVLLLLIWSLMPAVAALPFVMSGRFDTLLRAYFEAVSAFTTTGASALVPRDTAPRALVFWHAMLQWIGGATILLAIVLVIAPARIGGTPDNPLRLVETGARSERARFIGTAIRILPLYGTMTLACFIALALAGIGAFDAACLAFGALSTGGFAPRDGGLAIYNTFAIEAIVGLFMFVGASSIVWQRMVVWRRWRSLREHRETYAMAAVIVALGVAFAIGFYLGVDGPSGLRPVDALWKGLITAVSVISTTGFEVREGGFAAIPVSLLVAVTILGGGGFSTAGGIKFYRLGAMLKQARDEMNRLIHPHGVRSARFGSQPYDLQLMKAIWTGFMAYLGAIATTLMLLTLFGDSFEPSLVAAIAALSNAGPVYSGLAAGAGWPDFAQMSPAYSIILILAMVIGRLEVIAVFALLNPLYWRS